MLFSKMSPKKPDKKKSKSYNTSTFKLISMHKDLETQLEDRADDGDEDAEEYLDE